MSAKILIESLDLQPHPEGGFYRETYRSEDVIKAACLPAQFNGDRHCFTAIYFLLQQGDFSAFHRIRSDEIWHHYEGGTLLIHVVHTNGDYEIIRLGKRVSGGKCYQALVPAGAWFASEPAIDTDFILAGCTVAPGFDFEDFELAEKDKLRQQFPQYVELIERLCR